MTAAKQPDKSKSEQELQLAKELEMTFPASDPPASTQPGSGITGPKVKPGSRPGARESRRANYCSAVPNASRARPVS
jgi:hypothetical protein